MNDSIRLEARAWFARLRAHDCSAEDRSAFDQWRTADTRRADAYADLEDIWVLSAELAQEDPAIADAVRKARREDTRPWFGRQSWPLPALAASLIVGGLWFLMALLPNDSFHQYATAVGERRTVTLEDGSVVILDTATRMDVRLARRERNLVLHSGRADFKVHRDPGRPFVVKAGAADVTATGTQFQVRLDEGGGEVTLLEGAVVVSSLPLGAKVALSPRQRIAIDAAGGLGSIERLSDADRHYAEGWTAGQLVIKEWPLAKLVGEINRYGHTPLRLGDADIGQLAVSGTFDPEAPESLALALQYGWPVRAELGAREIVLYRHR